jgi:alpha-beta hydrolase superfamily lysophospholipase
MRRYLLFFVLCLNLSCKTTTASLSSEEATAPTRSLPDAAQKLWDAYASEQKAGVTLQPNCVPIQLKPPLDVPEKGLLIMYHGFSGCPIQFINIGRKLSAQGFHVLFPLLPGQGRVPLTFDRERRVVTDDQRGMPDNTAPYERLSQSMNAIAAEFPGYKVIAGLSGGGGQAMGTAVEGINPQTQKNHWDRVLLYVPFFKIPGIQGNVAGPVSVLLPGVYKGFGADCEKDQLNEADPRNGMCDFSLKHVIAMKDYGAKSAARAAELQVPIQIAGVEKDGASDDSAIIATFKNIASPDKHLCFYQEGVTHAVFYESDYKYPDTRTWVPEAEDAALDWILRGEAFPTNGPSIEPPNAAPADKQPRCKILAPLPSP